MRDDGVCTNTVQLQFFGGQGPARMADCKTNEVAIPNTVGMELVAARARLEGQPLKPQIVYKPAHTGERIDLVVGQFPARGTASAGDTVTLVLRKSLHNVVPNVVGLSLGRAQPELAKLKMQVATTGAAHGKVVAQSIQPRTASAPGEKIVLTVRGTGG
jgi:beta-lactam-binding protein with PASTA domain